MLPRDARVHCVLSAALAGEHAALRVLRTDADLDALAAASLAARVRVTFAANAVSLPHFMRVAMRDAGGSTVRRFCSSSDVASSCRRVVVCRLFARAFVCLLARSSLYSRAHRSRFVCFRTTSLTFCSVIWPTSRASCCASCGDIGARCSLKFRKIVMCV